VVQEDVEDVAEGPPVGPPVPGVDLGEEGGQGPFGVVPGAGDDLGELAAFAGDGVGSG
jgi:hypothetical protein